MSDYFHDSAFILELFKLVLLDNFLFDLFNGYDCMLPSTSINYSVSSFRDLSV